MNKLLIIIGCLILALVLGLTLTWPKYQNLQVLRLNIEAKQEELKNKETHFSQVKEISAELEKYTEPLAKIASALPETPDLAALFNFLQSSASQTGLILEKITLVSMAKGEIQVSCQLLGSYPAFKSFLLALEQSARLIEVESIAFESPEKSGESFEFAVEIKTNSY